MKTLMSLIAIFLIIPSVAWAEILFEDNFDSHADWSPAQQLDTNVSCRRDDGCATVPDGYAGYRIQGSYYTDPGNNTLNINSDNHRGPSGKALTFWHEVCNNCGWATDGILDIELDSAGYSDLYVRFYIKFDPSWQWNTSESPMQKFFKVTHYDGTGNPYDYFPPTPNSPNFTHQLAKWASGVSPISYMASYYYEGLDSEFGAGDDTNDSFTSGGTTCDWNEAGCPGDGNWHTFEYYLKMNSSPGAADGEHSFWYDGNPVMTRTGIVWSTSNGQVNPRRNFNHIWIGGNNYNHYTSAASEPEQWYAIDDIVVSTTYIGPESVPVGGYSQANTIPAAQLSQATDGSGVVTINFKALDEFANNPITLSGFEYSIDGGTTWNAPTGGDSSGALSTNWDDNSYQSGKYETVGSGGTSAEWSATTAYSFTLNAKHTDVADLNDYDGNVQFRFYVNNGNPTTSSNPVQTEAFALDTLSPGKPGSTSF